MMVVVARGKHSALVKCIFLGLDIQAAIVDLMYFISHLLGMIYLKDSIISG